MRGHAEVAGAGIAGLTVALALAQRGWSVRLHEVGASPRDDGAGIFLWENGLAVLTHLGLDEEVLVHSHAAAAWEERDGYGTSLGLRPIPLPGGIRMISMTRRDLYAALVAAVQRHSSVEVLYGSGVAAADPAGALVTADGRRWVADLVVGADGIGSRVRDSLELLAVRRRFDAFEIRRFLVPLSRAPESPQQWRNYVDYWDLAMRRRVLYAPCNERDLYLMLGAHPSDTDAMREPLDAGLWTSSFPVLAPVLEELPAAPHGDRYEFVELHRWSRGVAAIVGDGAHAMPPTIGQGAGTAMVNALSLAQAVSERVDVAAAVAAWERSERPATEETQRTSVERLQALIPEAGIRRDSWGGVPERLAARAVSTQE